MTSSHGRPGCMATVGSRQPHSPVPPQGNDTMQAGSGLAADHQRSCASAAGYSGPLATSGEDTDDH